MVENRTEKRVVLVRPQSSSGDDTFDVELILLGIVEGIEPNKEEVKTETQNILNTI